MSEKDKSITSATSAATKYEAMLAELGGYGTGPTEEKLLLIFKVFDQIVPHLGVFVSIMKMCRDEIFDAVYSERYTGSSKANSSQYIQRLPFFSIVQRESTKKDEKDAELSEKLEVVKKRLFDKQKQYEEAKESISELQEHISGLNKTIEGMQSELNHRQEDIKGLQSMIMDIKENAAGMENQLRCDILDLQGELQDSKAEANYLRQYKAGYDVLQAAFEKQPSLEEYTPKKKKRSTAATKRAHFISGIENCNKLEDQLLAVQNTTLEGEDQIARWFSFGTFIAHILIAEFDRFLEEHKSFLSGADERDAETDSDQDFFLQDDDVERADQQLLMMQERFQKNIHEISTELELLRQHKTMFHEQLQQIDDAKQAMKRKMKSRKGESRPTTQSSSLSVGFEKEEGDQGATADPFDVQERVFSKYAAMIYTSDNNGRTFHEFKDSKFCPSCGEKTVLCPHKILNQEHIFTLPPSVTHIKIARPKVRINLDNMENMYREEVATTDLLGGLSSAGGAQRGKSGGISLSANMSPCVTSKSPGDSLPTAFSKRHSVYRLWEDFKSRGIPERLSSRPLSTSRAISMIEEFAAHLISSDNAANEMNQNFHILDNLYNFLFQRYMKPEIAYLSAHDFLNSLVENSVQNKLMWLFTQCLIGNLDGSVFRYLLLMGDFINQVKWISVEDYRSFAPLVYPFLCEDDLETLHMGYTSFSENRISKNLVMEYVIHTIMKYREPRFLEMENKLLMTPGKEFNCMTETEFVESSDTALGVVNDKLRKRLFTEAQLYVANKDGVTNGVPILRLAQITSYLGLLHIAPVILEEVSASVNASRENNASALGSSRGSSDMPCLYPLLTLQGVKSLAVNINRRNKCRELHLQALEEEG
ncbi:hypothetical protein CAPTEDRAFT_225603 [Capitella teleta]|uniref:Uncharacterized protein n=1 Tax=Capitella teleta TaxID=283909 RepID=R7UD96_CAPTE|nr:hypothetical protein CAPTEDRAFT_225603 [Capitella teleta]|eukprot:ELU04076.1 hypothetical protein CAPTEDRAFT_225603 [Capitella teleta]